MASTGLNTILGAALVIFALVIGLTYGISALGVADSATNMTDSPYSDQYNATVDASTVSFSLLGYLPIVLVSIALVAGFVILRRLI